MACYARNYFYGDEELSCVYANVEWRDKGGRNGIFNISINPTEVGKGWVEVRLSDPDERPEFWAVIKFIIGHRLFKTAIKAACKYERPTKFGVTVDQSGAVVKEHPLPGLWITASVLRKEEDGTIRGIDMPLADFLEAVNCLMGRGVNFAHVHKGQRFGETRMSLLKWEDGAPEEEMEYSTLGFLEGDPWKEYWEAPGIPTIKCDEDELYK